jgi:putative oxidoreductase
MSNNYLRTLTLSNLNFLLLRFSTGSMMCYYHGWSKITAGSNRWERLGNVMTEFIGLDFLSIPLGFMASFSESIASLLIMVGLFTRPSAILLAITMFVAFAKNVSGKGIDGSELSLIYLLLSIIILINGAGRFSLDRLLFNKRS